MTAIEWPVQRCLACEAPMAPPRTWLGSSWALRETWRELGWVLAASNRCVRCARGA